MQHSQSVSEYIVPTIVVCTTKQMQIAQKCRICFCACALGYRNNYFAPNFRLLWPFQYSGFFIHLFCCHTGTGSLSNSDLEINCSCILWTICALWKWVYFELEIIGRMDTCFTVCSQLSYESLKPSLLVSHTMQKSKPIRELWHTLCIDPACACNKNCCSEHQT